MASPTIPACRPTRKAPRDPSSPGPAGPRDEALIDQARAQAMRSVTPTALDGVIGLAKGA